MPRSEVAHLVTVRLRPEFRPGCIRQTSVNLTDHGWVARVGIWPHTPEIVEKVKRALAPMEAISFAQPQVP